MTTYSKLASPSATREVLDNFGLATKHSLGQNFLVSDAVIGRILELAQPSHNDIVLEVGPGIGTLTCALLPRAKAVVAIEADSQLPPVLGYTCAGLGKMILIEGDATRVSAQDITQVLSAELADETAPTPASAAAPAGLGTSPAPAPTAFIANLPYQVAATLVLRYFEEMPSINRAIVMVQTEVACRMAASPNTKTYGAYTAKLALVGKVVDSFDVSPHNFMPAPHVSSTVIRIERRSAVHPNTDEALSCEELSLCRRVIDAAFMQRRKTIRNAMKAAGFDAALLDAAYEAAGIDAGCRAESLTPESFIRLSMAIGELYRGDREACCGNKGVV